MKNEQPRTLGQEQRRLLSFMGWEHGKPLNDNVRGMLGWHFGTKGTYEKDGRTFCQLVPGKSVFMIHPRVMANWIMFYIDGKISKQDLLAVKMDYDVMMRINRNENIEASKR